MLFDCLSRIGHDRVEPRKEDLIADLRAFYKVVLSLGIRDDARAQFWNYFYKLVRYHPRDLSARTNTCRYGISFSKINGKVL